MTKQYTRILALLLVLLTFATVLLAGCKQTEETPAPTEPEVTTTENQTDETEPPVQETEPPRTPGMYRITILPTANGTVTADCTDAKEGERITLTLTPDEGYEVVTLIVNDQHGEATFDMPAEDVTVLARFGYPEGVDWKVYPNGDFFGSAGTIHSSDVLDMSTDTGKKPYLVMDAGKATPLYAYVKGMTDDQFYLELTAKVTGIRSDEKYPKFGLMTNDGAEMVKFYLDMTTDKQVGTVGAVHQASGKGDDWAGQSTWKLNKALNLKSQTVKLALLRNGKNYYFYVNDVLVAIGNDLSRKNAATGIFSFGTSLKVTDYKLIKSENEINSLLNKAKADVAAFNGLSLSENYFSQVSDGVYSITTNSDAQHLVDDVMSAGKVVREQYYSLKGKLSLTNASDWGQARILISADPQNEYVIALEKLGESNYQIFTMSKANEEGWNNWTLIDDAQQNGSRNSIDFEVVVIGDEMHFLIDDAVYYTSNRVSMTESTIKFTGYNAGTTTVENLTMEVFADEAAAQAYADSKQSRFGENFGVSQGAYWTTNGVDLTNDNGETPTVSIVGGAPQYAYWNDIFTDKFCFETEFNVTSVLNNDAYPKFGIMVKDSKEMVKFFVDMTAEMTASKVGVVYQPTDGGDDWENSVSCDVAGMSFAGNDTVKLKVIRDGKTYYFYVNDQLVLYSEDGFEAEQGAVGIFSFNGVLTASNYTIAIDDAANGAIEQAKEDFMSFAKLGLTTNYFTETADGVYTLTTNSDAQHLVDDLIFAGRVVRERYYSLKGKLSLTNARDWGQARILISTDAQNEYVIALEKTNSGKYQIFTMSKAGEEGWNNWTLIDHVEQNGSRNSIDFEVVVIGDELYFLIDNEVYYTSNRVSMTESTVKFTGYNACTTTVENLALEVFADEAAAQAYANSKQSRFGENFGVSQNAYWTTNGVDLTNDNGENPAVSIVDGAPQYAYLNDIFTDKFCFETEFNVTTVLNNDAYPKFGIMVNGNSEMVKFFVDMTSEMTAAHVGVVYQPTGGGDDWANSRSVNVPGMAFTGSDTVKLKLVRDGRAYYFYVNDSLVLYDKDGFKAEKGAVGIFSFNAKLTASNYSVLLGDDADSTIENAKNQAAELTKLGLTCNWFTDGGNGAYRLTTNSNAEHKVDDLTQGGSVLRTAYYSVKGKLSLTNAGDWGQARILVSADAKNEYFIALERTAAGKYQIFTMSKANQTGWDKWELILHEDVNGTRYSIDYEIIVIGNKLYFLIDDTIVYSSTRVSMTESTVKFTGYNVGTTTVENLSAEVFNNQQEVESYLAEKSS